MNSSWIESSTITVPSEVQRWPAVPKPLNSAPSTARSSVASGITTSGFLPPSSRQGFCRWRPQSSPRRLPTSLEPVKPTLSTSPASSACSRPSNAVGPSHGTRFSTPSGRPPWRKSWVRASPSAGAYSAGFQTTALPHRSAGTRYQDGTATGKLPAVTIAATPTGLRKVKSCLSDISDGTVCPYSRRPSDTKKLQVSMISCTSPSDSAYGLPISRVTRRESASLLSSTRRPICWIALPRTGGGTSAQAAWASRAARQAATKVDASPRSASATTSEVSAGLVELSRPPGASVSVRPETMEATVRVCWARVSVMQWIVERRLKLAALRPISPRVEPEQITRNASAISGAVKMLEREIATFLESLAVSSTTDEGRRQIADYLTELHFHFRALSERAAHLEAEARNLEQAA